VASVQPVGGTGAVTTFELLSQDWPPLNTIHKAAINTFQQANPQAKINLTSVSYGDIPTKIKTSIAAGVGPDGFFHYGGFWRGVDAAKIMLPLTPQVFQRSELEQRFYPNLLQSVAARNNEVYFLPALVGIGAGCIIHNVAQLAAANIDPKGFTSLDAIMSAATSLTVRQGSDITRAGLLFGHTTTLPYRWVLDQGGKFYDSQTHQWSWQTPEAAKAMQWLADAYTKWNVAWQKAPAGVKDGLGEGRASMLMEGPYALSGYAASFPALELQDQPLPGFVQGKSPIYYEPELAGYSLSALLKPAEPKTQVGAAFFRQLLSPEGVLTFANEYSGAILINGLYTDPRFKTTKFGAVRSWMPDMISKLVLTPTAADPGFSGQLTKVFAGQMSIQAALAEMQQLYSAAEDKAQQAMT